MEQTQKHKYAFFVYQIHIFVYAQINICVFATEIWFILFV
jgi:hypothetical protein